MQKQKMQNEKELKQGVIEAYIHQNKRVGVLVDLRCETDFVAKNEEFKKLAHEICLQVAAMNPLFLSEENIQKEFLAEKRKIYEEQLKDSEKPKKIIDEIIEGKLKKYKEEISLLSQPWIRDEKKNMKNLIDEYQVKFKENISIKRFVRFEI